MPIFQNPLDIGRSGGGDDYEPACESCQLSKKQRLYGFGICFGLGFVLSIMGTLFLIMQNVTAFAVMYTLGNMTSLAGTGFLIGPMKQFKQMFDSVRLIASIVFLSCMVATILVAVFSPIGFLALIFVGIQWCAFTWYCASYIPYGRTLIKKCLGSAVGS